jgi:hypothetical protein
MKGNDRQSFDWENLEDQPEEDRQEPTRSVRKTRLLGLPMKIICPYCQGPAMSPMFKLLMGFGLGWGPAPTTKTTCESCRKGIRVSMLTWLATIVAVAPAALAAAFSSPGTAALALLAGTLAGGIIQLFFVPIVKR